MVAATFGRGVYTYRWYGTSAHSLSGSGSTVAAGWLEGVTDPAGKFVAAVVKCHTKQADGAFKQKPADDEDCESAAPDKSAKAKLDAAVAKVADACPPGVVTNATTLEGDLLTGVQRGLLRVAGAFTK